MRARPRPKPVPVELVRLPAVDAKKAVGPLGVLVGAMVSGLERALDRDEAGRGDSEFRTRVRPPMVHGEDDEGEDR